MADCAPRTVWAAVVLPRVTGVRYMDHAGSVLSVDIKQWKRNEHCIATSFCDIQEIGRAEATFSFLVKM